MRMLVANLRGAPRGEEAPGGLRSQERSRLAASRKADTRGAGLLESALALPVLLPVLGVAALGVRHGAARLGPSGPLGL